MISVLIALLTVLGAALIILIIRGPRMLLCPKRRTPDYYQSKFGLSHPSQLDVEYEEETLKTNDGLSLNYWSIKGRGCAKPSNSVIYLHGITDSRVSGLGYAKELVRKDLFGENICPRIFLIDMRRHGESEGAYCTYGFHEKKDVVSLIDVIKQRNPSGDLTLLGNSMGAAIAIQTAAIDDRVNRVIAIAPFYDLFSIALDHEARKIGMRNKLLLKVVLKRAERIASFNSAEVSPAEAIKKIKSPILIVYGENDHSVRREYPERLAKLAGNARLLIVPGAGHVDVLEKGGDAFMMAVANFIKTGI